MSHHTEEQPKCLHTFVIPDTGTKKLSMITDVAEPLKLAVQKHDGCYTREGTGQKFLVLCVVSMLMRL